MYNQNLGMYGERIAAEYLQKRGFQIVEKNFKANYGEIDIVAQDGETLVFVEVKTRVGDDYGEPLESATPKKLREVIKTAQFYLLKNNLDLGWRIDVVAIALKEDMTVEEVEYFENVTL